MASDMTSARSPSIQCKYCDKAFNKGEHLRRHERSHTGSRPFACKDCGRAFSRQDSLLRHQRLHTRPDGTQNPSPPSTNNEASPLSPTDSPAASTNASWIERKADGEGLNEVQFENGGFNHGGPQNMASSAELDFELIWPDTEDLFQSITSVGNVNQLNMPVGPLPIPYGLTDFAGAWSPGSVNSFIDRASSIGAIPSGGNHHAVQGVRKMVAGLSSSVTAAAEASSITSVFLDECLHLFFVKFIPTFPILHRATFVFRESTHPLLLNAIAIGSLYLGPKDAIAKGEILWRLAHIALTTSWEKLITHRGPSDACKGVQLVVTALLGSVYGALSKNRSVRSTSHVFHSLGFFWARHCGMVECEPYSLDDLPSLEASQEEIEREWRHWAAREIQQRALLGHYILDGLIARMSGKPTSVRHAANQLCPASNEAVFEASNAQDWLVQMHAQHVVKTSYRSMFRSAFSVSGRIPATDYTSSPFSTRVILEGFQSLVLDCTDDENDDEGCAIGVPSKVDIRRALAQVHEGITNSIQLPAAEKLEIFLRWHAICLDACVDPSRLCRSMCARYGIEQHVWGGEAETKSETDFIPWASTQDARRALLHAVAIQELVEELPRGRAHVIHMPTSLFSAATVYTAFALAGSTTVNLPRMINWKEALFSDIDPCIILAELSNPPTDSETQHFIHGRGPLPSFGASRNLLYELNSMQKLFRCLFSQWGLAYDMEAIIDQWIALCH